MNHSLRLLLFLVLLGVVTWCGGCAPVHAWERGNLAHYTMATTVTSGPAEEHMYAVHEGAAGGGAAPESGCGCN
jgi:hypothetical protein